MCASSSSARQAISQQDKSNLFCNFFKKSFANIKICITFALANKEITLRQIKIHRGMEQLAARRAHNPKVVWFESHSRYSKGETAMFLFFFVAGVVCYLSPKPPFCKGGLFIHLASFTTNLHFSMKRLELSILCATKDTRDKSKDLSLVSFFCSVEWDENDVRTDAASESRVKLV